MESLVKELLGLFSIELVVLIISALPVIELRGAIPVGVSLGLSPVHATVISLIGSMLPVPVILFAVKSVFRYLKTTRMFNGLVHKLTDRSLAKSGNIQKYGALGLILFVAIPLPGTGVWGGSLAAVLLNMQLKRAFPAILAGNIIAAVLIMTLSYGVLRVLV